MRSHDSRKKRPTGPWMLPNATLTNRDLVRIGIGVLLALGGGALLVFTSGCWPKPVTCAAAPSCEPGDKRVDECPEGESCYTNSMCSSTVTCLPGAGDAGRDVAQDVVSCTTGPVCDRGDRRVAVCPDAASCYTRSACNTTITCLPGGGSDADAGYSDAGDASPDATDTSPPPNDAIADGGETGPRDATCRAIATCDSGDKPVSLCPDGGSCYTRTKCNSTITCLRTGDGGYYPPDGATCQAVPTCNSGDKRVSHCPDGGSCYTRTLCRHRITCLRGGGSDAGDVAFCLAVPTCHSGDKQVQYCPDGGSCYTRSRCNKTITCLRSGSPDADGSP